MSQIQIADNNGAQALAVVGGGITGLTAAYYAIKNGQPASFITIYEATDRLGGKIKTAYLGNGTPINFGAEFIDSDHEHLLALCHELKVPLKRSADEGKEIFQRPNGQLISGEQFHAAFAPLANRIIRDKAAVQADPNGPLAQRMNALSLNDYITDLRLHTPVEPHPSLWRRVANFVIGNPNRVSAEIATMAMQAYASELGQPSYRVNALQYLHEASDTPGTFLNSDCAYRVEGGTEKLINALEKKLKEQGVKFEQNASVTQIAKQTGGIALTFDKENHAPVQTDKVILALPAYALGKIGGLTSLGMAPEVQSFINGTQYNNSVKFSIKLKDGVTVPKGYLFANHGYQASLGDSGEMNFLVNADKLLKLSESQLMNSIIECYAKSLNTTADQLFDTSPGNVLFNNPGRNACYASPRPGEARQLEKLAASLETMAEQGVAVAGTFLPLQVKSGGIGLGFMECGAASSQRAIDCLIQPTAEKPQWLSHIIEKKSPPPADRSMSYTNTATASHFSK